MLTELKHLQSQIKVYTFQIFHTVVRQNSQTTRINNLLRTDVDQRIGINTI